MKKKIIGYMIIKDVVEYVGVLKLIVFCYINGKIDVIFFEKVKNIKKVIVELNY